MYCYRNLYVTKLTINEGKNIMLSLIPIFSSSLIVEQILYCDFLYNYIYQQQGKYKELGLKVKPSILQL